MYNIFLSNFFILSYFTYLGYSIFHFRFTNKILNLFIFLLCFILACTLNSNGPSRAILIKLCILHFIYFFIMFKGDISKCLLALVPFPLIVIISEFVTANILNVIAGVDASLNMNSYIFCIAIILSNVCIGALVFCYIKLCKLFIKTQLPKYSWMIFILPVCSFFFLLNLNKNYFYFIRGNDILFLSIIGIFISNFVTLYIFYKMLVLSDVKKNLIEAENREKILSLRFDLMSNHYKTNFTLLHDLLHRCNSFKEALEKKKYTTMEQDVNELYQITFKEFNSIYSNLIVLNYLIAERIHIFKEQDITINSSIEYNDFQQLAQNDQISLFTILLDYAISMVLEVASPRNIIVKTQKKDYQILIQVIYSSNGNASLSKDVENSIHDLLLKYNAFYSIKYNEINKMSSFVMVFPQRITGRSIE